GLGTPGYLAGEMLKQAFGLDLVAVSFNGGGPAITSTVGGATPILYTSISTPARHIKKSTVRALPPTRPPRSPPPPHRTTPPGPARRTDARGSGRAWSGIRNHPRRAGAGGNTAGRHRPLASRDRQDRRAGGGAGAPFSAWIRADRQHAQGIRRPDPMGNRQV